MIINIITEPEYADTVWCRETLTGIEKKCSALRYKHISCSADMLNSADASNKTILVGTSPGWVLDVLNITERLKIHSVVVSCRPIKIKQNTSCVLIDHDSATEECIEYLKSCGRKKIALYGINNNSYADMIKVKYFKDKDVYYCAGKNGMESCFNSFVSNIGYYDAAVCSNYISAVYLMHNLKNKGIDVPKDLFVAAYGDSVIGKSFKPSLTTITLDHEQLGIQAVNLCRFLAFSDGDVSAAVRIPGRIVPAESTQYIAYKKSVIQQKSNKLTENIFKVDADILEIQALEKLLRLCDETDIKLLKTISENMTYAGIGDSLYISEGAVKYRLKRMLSGSEIASVGHMRELYNKYVGSAEK